MGQFVALGWAAYTAGPQDKAGSTHNLTSLDLIGPQSFSLYFSQIYTRRGVGLPYLGGAKDLSTVRIKDQFLKKYILAISSLYSTRL